MANFLQSYFINNKMRTHFSRVWDTIYTDNVSLT